MKTAVIYARYSSERQTEQSIEGQLHVCRDYAKRNDIIVVDTYIDRAMTGTNDNRSAFQRMLKDSNKHAWDYVLVYKLDRFSRNKYEMAMHRKTLRDNGIKILSAMENIPDSPEGIILESLLEGMAEYYSAELSQKVKRGLRESRSKGNFTGGFVLYGYKVTDKKLSIDEDKANVIRFIYSQYAAGMYVKDIIAALTEKGILYNNKPFARTTVYNILKNEKYGGIFRHEDEVYTNIYPRIISKEIFKIVRSKILANRYGKHAPDVIYILKGKIFCGYCGKPITSETGTAKSGSVKRYYKCSGKKKGNPCQNLAVRKDVLEQIIVDAIHKAFFSSTTVFDIAEKVYALYLERLSDRSEINILLAEKHSLEKSINNILSAIEKGITTASTKKRLTDLEEHLEHLECKLATAKAKLQVEIKRDDIIRFIKTALKKTPQQLINLLVNKIVLFNDRIEITCNYADKERPDGNRHRVFSIYYNHYSLSLNHDKFKRPFVNLEYDVSVFI